MAVGKKNRGQHHTGTGVVLRPLIDGLGCGGPCVALEELERNIDTLMARIRAIARIVDHSSDLHVRGELRFLRGEPPARAGDGLKDCRIYEAVLDIMRADAAARRPARVFLTSDRDFADPALVNELAALGATLRHDAGRLYAELSR